MNYLKYYYVVVIFICKTLPSQLMEIQNSHIFIVYKNKLKLLCNQNSEESHVLVELRENLENIKLRKHKIEKQIPVACCNSMYKSSMYKTLLNLSLREPSVQL